MPILVMKFGGTSVANIDRIHRAAKRVAVEVAKGYDVIVIVSAMSGETNKLVGFVNETSPLYDAREYDAVVASGENVTAGLMALGYVLWEQHWQRRRLHGSGSPQPARARAESVHCYARCDGRHNNCAQHYAIFTVPW